METDTLNTEKWKFEKEDTNYLGNTIYMVKTSDDFWIAGNLKEKDAELITAAVNSCKEINKDNPLKVAIGLPRLFEVLDEVVNDKRFDWELYGELADIFYTIKSNFKNET